MKRTPLKRGSKQLKRSPLKGGSSSLKRSKINPISSKEKINRKNKLEAYRSIDTIREQKCEGCGMTNKPLSHSHLVSESFDKTLADNSMNIRLHCLDWGQEKGCHNKWEHGQLGEVDKMLDFEENMKIIEHLNNKFYQKKKYQIYEKSS